MKNLKRRFKVMFHMYGWHMFWLLPAMWFDARVRAVKAAAHKCKLLWYRIRYPEIRRLRKLAGLK